MGVTIINNDYSNINFTQNINIEKYVKKKKTFKKKYGQMLTTEILSEFLNTKRGGGSKMKKSKKQKQKDQFIQIYNVPSIKPVPKMLSGTSSQINVGGPKNKLSELISKKPDMVIQGNIGRISIAKQNENYENEEQPLYQNFYGRNGSLDSNNKDFASIRIPSIQSRQSIENNDQQYRLIKLKEKNLIKTNTGLKSHQTNQQPQVFFPQIEKKMTQGANHENMLLQQSYESKHGSRSASLS